MLCPSEQSPEGGGGTQQSRWKPTRTTEVQAPPRRPRGGKAQVSGAKQAWALHLVSGCNTQT